ILPTARWKPSLRAKWTRSSGSWGRWPLAWNPISKAIGSRTKRHSRLRVSRFGCNDVRCCFETYRVLCGALLPARLGRGAVVDGTVAATISRTTAVPAEGGRRRHLRRPALRLYPAQQQRPGNRLAVGPILWLCSWHASRHRPIRLGLLLTLDVLVQDRRGRPGGVSGRRAPTDVLDAYDRRQPGHGRFDRYPLFYVRRRHQDGQGAHLRLDDYVSRHFRCTVRKYLGQRRNRRPHGGDAPE